ncbi:ribosome biogenesis GTPase Der [Candidatus Purcelliella pentastirinorum]|uniref:ribosome biogenesis GTPase Der n=1 Tax=Candidatus Purcelliella pentastirinorum TaxID=472834 RepID=UPI00236790FC|nr:ribosome biogenesis GTPase Der [Candidatus Purcelliella pentastirinorum]WDI78838.1 ribosome biogenesis GTPase Der [Candidatus Purcelliella pentastirinorum]WDR79971.1 ribosome biogenesis GTPase Der [Candidatus Purcelliella pentastirinorum]
MIPIISLIGRTNVGKSTLFNILTGTKSAIVNKLDNFTRDCKYGYIKRFDKNFIIIDTPAIRSILDKNDYCILEQSISAINKSNIIFFILNAIDGVMSDDYLISNILRTKNKFVILIINKVNDKNSVFQFYSLGFKNIYFIDCFSKKDILSLFCKEIYPIIFDYIGNNFYSEKILFDKLIINSNYFFCSNKFSNKMQNNIKLACIGQPNVGKSTLINNILGEKRLTVNSLPGTTRDSIYVYIKRGLYNYILIDTAGLKKNKIGNKYNNLDEYSIYQSIKSIDYADIILLIIDVNLGFLDQDLYLLNLIISKGKSFIIIVNKCENISLSLKKNIKLNILNRISFINNFEIHFISALYGYGINNIFNSTEFIFSLFKNKFSSKYLTNILLEAINKHCLPVVNRRSTKLKYAHFGGYSPFMIIIHGKVIKNLSRSYKRYLINYFSKSLKLVGISLIIKFKEANNPYIN